MWGKLVSMSLCFFMLIPLVTVAEPADEPKDDGPGPWYFFSGNSSNHPPLNKADRQIDRQLNKPFQVLAPGLDDVRSFSDEAEDFKVWTPYAGVGRLLSPHWDLFWQAGYSKGKVRTNQTEPSFLILPLHSDVTIYRSCFFTSLGLAYYPWEVPEMRKFDSVGERLKCARPYLVTTLNWNYLTCEVKIKAGLRPFDNLLHMTQKDEWNPWSTGVGAGVEIPLSQSVAISLNAQYSFYWTQEEDFSGPLLNFHWKKMF